jgi:predicted Zn-dependent protease with MMP-like domain
VEADDFERAIEDALDELPEWSIPFLENVAILAAEEDADEPDILGLYIGVPETERGHEEPIEPPRILIFRKPLVAMTSSREELRDEIRITVLHEVAHHFGISDERLDELGWS